MSLRQSVLTAYSKRMPPECSPFINISFRHFQLDSVKREDLHFWSLLLGVCVCVCAVLSFLCVCVHGVWVYGTRMYISVCACVCVSVCLPVCVWCIGMCKCTWYICVQVCHCV